MGLIEIIKDFFDRNVRETMHNFERNGIMMYTGRNFPEQILLRDRGYIFVHNLNVGCLKSIKKNPFIKKTILIKNIL